VALKTGVALNCEIHGDGPPSLLVGGPHRAQLFNLFQVPAFTRAGYRVVTVDHRGVPPSDVPPPPYTVEEMAADIAALIEVLELQPCAVVGYSLGALIAQQLVLEHPELVSRAVFCGMQTTPSALLRAVDTELIHRLQDGVSMPPLTVAVLRALQLFGPRRLANDSFVESFLPFLAEPLGEGSCELGLMQASAGYIIRPERVAAIRRPCLVLAFEHDVLTPPHQGRELASMISGCRYSEIPSAGHAGLLEKPTEVNRAILEFLCEDTSPSRAGS
jgi:thioesterase CepJ